MKSIVTAGLVVGFAVAPVASAAQVAPAGPPPASPAMEAPRSAGAEAAPPTVVVPPVPAAPRYTSISNADADALQELIGDARRGDVNGGRDAMARISEPSARRLGLWLLLDTNGPSMGFAEVDRSLRDMADWPRPARRRLAAERLIATSGLTPRQVIAWFGREAPATPEGSWPWPRPCAASATTGQRRT
ncbi:hypothetical protein [Phenylobacterium parvum]|uniref:hypothetical protein n=1 Tax=Phenylobacterium parvum TaxID=2201350 RepID=UPI0013A53356|nr:hypothetical protein [Phenylobacterium parvum]